MPTLEQEKITLGSNSLTCPKCSKRVEVTGEVKGKANTIYLYSCGHSEMKDNIISASAFSTSLVEIDKDAAYKFESLNGKKLYPYQIGGVKFIEDANGRALIADEMALGKTIQALAFMRIHPEEGPFLVICKAATVRQWIREIEEWVFCVDHSLSETRDISKTVLTVTAPELLLPGFNAYVSSYDIWAERKGKKKSGGLEKEGNNIQDTIKRMGIKTVILDEVQQIKNSDSKRTKVIRKICFYVKNIIELSGTPIKNNAKEYFNALNLLSPRLFPTEVWFLKTFVEIEWTGRTNKYAGIKNPEHFKNYTNQLIIRRERADVLPDLPLITRNYSYYDLGDEVQAAYAKVMEEFIAKFDEGGFKNTFEGQNDLLAFLARMRHLTGISKITSCIDFLVEFLNSCDRKIVIFCHHKDVADILHTQIKELCKNLEIDAPLSLYNIPNDGKDYVLQQFKNTNSRIMLASTLADGEGLNMQFCADCIILERQWNPANEEQAEARFPRPGQLADKINANYLVAVGTIDEYFAEIVENKRRWVNSTMKGEKIDKADWNQNSLIGELAQVIASKGRRKWTF